MIVKPVKIDAKDRKLLYELSINSRRSLTWFAKSLNLSVPSIAYRIKRLEKNKVIIGFNTVIDPSVFGLMNFDVWFELSHSDESGRKKFIEHLEKNQEVIWLIECSGKFDCAIAVLATDVVSFSDKLYNLTLGFEAVIENKHITIAGRQWNPIPGYLVNQPQKTEPLDRRSLSGTKKRILLGGLERGVLKLLIKNARISIVEIAKKLNVSPITVRAKIKKLEQEVIVGYRVHTQPAELGMQNYEVLVSTNNMDKEKENQIINYCLSDFHCTVLLLTIGRWDLNFAFNARDNEHAQQVMASFRSRFGSVIRGYELIQTMRVRKVGSIPSAFL